MSRPSARALTSTMVGVAVIVAMAALAHAAMAAFQSRVAKLNDIRTTNARLSVALERLAEAKTGQVAGLSKFALDYQKSADEAVAVADLQSALRAMALSRRVELTTLNTLPPRQSGGVPMTGVRLSLRAPLREVQSLLHEIEAGQPILFVERLAIRADQNASVAASPEVQGAPLFVELDVFAPRRPTVIDARADHSAERAVQLEGRKP